MAHILVGRLAAWVILGKTEDDQLLGFPVQHKPCFFVLAFLLSILLGARGIAIKMREVKHENIQAKQAKNEINRNTVEWTLLARILHYVHAGVDNSVGSLAGWVALYMLSYRLLTYAWLCPLPPSEYPRPNLHLLGWPDLALAVLALLGITGKLPETVQGFIMSIAEAVKSLTGKVAKS